MTYIIWAVTVKKEQFSLDHFILEQIKIEFRPFPSVPQTSVHSEIKCEAIYMKITFYYHANETRQGLQTASF